MPRSAGFSPLQRPNRKRIPAIALIVALFDIFAFSLTGVSTAKPVVPMKSVEKDFYLSQVLDEAEANPKVGTSRHDDRTAPRAVPTNDGPLLGTARGAVRSSWR